jgi:hypothetical protein
MAQTSASPYSGYAATPAQLPTADNAYGSKTIVYRAVITFAAQAAADTIKLMKLPKGVVPLYGILNNDTSTGSATIAIGNATTAGKYRAAAVKTTTNAPEIFGVVAAAVAAGLSVPLNIRSEGAGLKSRPKAS